MKRSLLLCVLLSCCMQVWAQQRLWTLSACIRQAQDSQFLARNAVLAEQMAASEKREAGRALLPALRLDAGQDLSGSRFGVASSAILDMRLPLYQGGYLRSQLQYREAVQAYAGGLRKRTLAGIKWTVVELFLQALLARNNYYTAQELLSRLDSKAKDNPAAVYGYLLTKYENLLTGQEQAYSKARQQLMEYIYQPVDPGDSLVAVNKTFPEYDNFDSAIANGLLTDAGLKADQLNLTAARAQVKYKDRAAWPALAIDAYYGPLWQSRNVFRYPGGDFSSGLSLHLNAPLFNMGSIRKDREQARLSVSQASLKLREDTRLLCQDMLQYYAQHRLSLQQLAQATLALQAADSLLGNAGAYNVPGELLLAADQWYAASLEWNSARYQLLYQTLWVDFNSGKL